MRIVCDLQACQGNGRLRGIGRYSLALALAMARQAQSHEVWIALSGCFPETLESLQQAFSGQIPAHQIVTYNVPTPVAYSAPANHWRMRASECLREHFLASLEPDIVHVASVVEGLSEDIVTSIGTLPDRPPNAATLYDLIPLIWPDIYLPNPFLKTWYSGKLDHVKRADLLLSISGSARSEAIELLGVDPTRVVNISTAANDFFRPVEIQAHVRDALLNGLGIQKPFFLYTANFEPRKNLETLIKAFGLLPLNLRERFQLVIVCAPDAEGRAKLLNSAKASALGIHDLVMTGYVDDEKLRMLYCLCHLFVYPSLHEGFGIPLLEAMQCGAPAIGSNTTSIPEVIGRADAMFDPTKPAAISSLMARSIADGAFLENLRQYAPTRAAAFSWDHTARVALSAFEDCVARTGGPQVARSLTARGWSGPYKQLIEACGPLLATRSTEDRAALAAAIASNLGQCETGLPIERGNAETVEGGETVRIEQMCYPEISGDIEAPSEPPGRVPLRSALCRQADFMRDGFRYWMREIGETPRFHRKQWEFYYAIQALYERDLLNLGCRGLGFGVGTEPLPALFAARGVKVLASDQGIEDAARAGWSQTGQHTNTIMALNERGICNDALFRDNVSFREIDMNSIPSDLSGQFDFCWSACCLEHLGSIQNGLDFIVASIETLRPGGVAVHTTEYNMLSNDKTIESRDLSLFRKRDIESVILRLEEAGHRVERVDWSEGCGFLDGYIDLPPYKQEPHLRLKIGEFPCTSIGLIITKADPNNGAAQVSGHNSKMGDSTV